MFFNLREDVSKYYIKVLSLRSYFIFKMKKHHEKSTNNKLLMIKTYLSKTSIFKAFAAVCIFGISISGCTSKKKTPMETTDTTENELTMLVGTYTSGTSKGIYSYRFHREKRTSHSLKWNGNWKSFLSCSICRRKIRLCSQWIQQYTSCRQCICLQ